MCIGKKEFLISCIFLILFYQNCLSFDSLEVAKKLHRASQFQKALPIYIELTKKFKKINDVSNYSLCQLKIADIIRNYGGTNLAIELLNTNQKLMEVKIERPSFIMAQNFIAKAEAQYTATKFTEFKSSILKSIAIKKSIGLSERYFAEDYLHLARYYLAFHNQQSDSCFFWATKSLILSKLDKQNSIYLLPRIYNLLGYYYHPKSFGGFLDKRKLFYELLITSRKYYDSAIHALSYQPLKDDLMMGKIYQNLGNSYNNEFQADQKEETMTKAMSCYKKCIALYENYGNPTELVEKYWVIAKGYQRIGNYDSSIFQVQKALKLLVPDFISSTHELLPAIQSTLNDSWYSSLVALNAENYYQRGGKKNMEVQDLKLSIDHYQHVLRFHRFILSHSLNQIDAINWSYYYGTNLSQRLLAIEYEYFQSTDNINLIKDSYGLLSSAKYASLNTKDLELNAIDKINLSVLGEERRLVADNIMKNIPSLSSEKLISILPESPMIVNEKHALGVNFINDILNSISIQQVQQVTKNENAMLIDFYSMGQDLYAVIIGEGDFKIVRQKLPVEFYSSLKRFNRDLLNLKPSEYSHISNLIYKEVLDSILMGVPKKIDKLIICSDSQLEYIPWEALAIDTVNTKTFKEINYLLNHYTIQTVLTPVQLSKHRKNSTNGFYGVASHINGRRFSSIPFSSSLIEKIAKQQNGRATTTFSKDSIAPEIFHVAAHVVNDSLRPYNSSIYFDDNDSITISELSSSKITPRLAILNACQTATGIHMSEGSMSFARAFYRLGAESVLMTLWSVDDKATADVLGNFYDQIEEGIALDISLRKSKIDFIKHASSDELANPYYWAGLQLTGSANPVLKSNRKALIFGGGFIIALAALVGFLVRKNLFLKKMNSDKIQSGG